MCVTFSAFLATTLIDTIKYDTCIMAPYGNVTKTQEYTTYMRGRMLLFPADDHNAARRGQSKEESKQLT